MGMVFSATAKDSFNLVNEKPAIGGSAWTKKNGSGSNGGGKRHHAAMGAHKSSFRAASKGNAPTTSHHQQRTLCKVCGRPHLGECNHYSHPDSNRSDLPWAATEQGKKFLKLGYATLPPHLRVDGSVLPNPTSGPNKRKRDGHVRFEHKQGEQHLFTIDENPHSTRQTGFFVFGFRRCFHTLTLTNMLAAKINITP
jgi:hypothetical protein